MALVHHLADVNSAKSSGRTEGDAFGRFLGTHNDGGRTRDSRFSRADAFCVFVLYVALLAAYFLPLIPSGWVLSGNTSDITIEWWWKRIYLGESLREGRLPIMNPFISAGVPFLASNQTAVFYPPNWMFAFLSPAFVFNVHTIGHFWLGLAAMHLLARRLRRSTSAAVIAALVFGFSGFAILHWRQGHLVFVIAWPWTPFAVHAWLNLQRAVSRRIDGVAELLRPRRDVGALGWALALAAILAIQFFSGHPQISYFTILALAILNAWWALFGVIAWMRGRSSQALRAVVSGTVWTIGAGLLSGAMIAVQAIPTYEFSRMSVRGGRELWHYLAGLHALAPGDAITLLAPYALGGRVGGQFFLSEHTFASLWEIGGFLTVTAALLALGRLMLAAFRRSLPGWETAVVVLLVFSFWMAMGPFGKLHTILLGRLPGLDLFRCPGRFLYLVDFAAGLLAASGFDLLVRAAMTPAHRPSRQRAFRFSLLTLALLVCSATVLFEVLFYKEGESAAFIRLVANRVMAPFAHRVNIMDPYYVNSFWWTYETGVKTAIYTGAAALGVMFLLRVPRAARFARFALVALVIGELLVFAWPNRWSFDSVAMQWPKAIVERMKEAGPRWRTAATRRDSDLCQGMAIHVRNASGVDPLSVFRYGQVLHRAQGYYEEIPPQNMSIGVATPLTRLLATRWLVTSSTTRLRDQTWKRVMDAEGTALYEDAGAIRRGFTVPVAEVSPLGVDLAPVLNHPGFDPRRTVVISDARESDVAGVAPVVQFRADRATSAPADAAEFRPADVGSNVAFIRDDPEFVEVKVRLDQPGWFVLMDQLLPGWSARVDGADARMFLANASGRAFALGSGEHRIEMTYRAPGLRTGAWISGVAWGIWVVLLGWVWWWRRRGGERKNAGRALT